MFCLLTNLHDNFSDNNNCDSVGSNKGINKNQQKHTDRSFFGALSQFDIFSFKCIEIMKSTIALKKQKHMHDFRYYVHS